MANIVTISGMFGDGKTYFADSPVVIGISGLQWPASSPFNIVVLEVIRDGITVGSFHADTGGQSSIAFDISSALRAIWSGYDFTGDGDDPHEVFMAQEALAAASARPSTRAMRDYSLCVYTEYLSSDDGGVFTRTQYRDADGNTVIPGGQCLIGGLTEWERSLIDDDADADVSYWEHTGVRNGDASTKPVSSPERVGCDSITSWVDVQEGYTKSIFYPKTATPAADDTPSSQTGWTGHAPIVLRDDVRYTDFLFVNRRGAVETCSARMLEGMNISVKNTQYGRIERPSFRPSRSLMAISKGGRRSFSMSSGYQTREWAEWWTMEFLKARQWWMLLDYTEGGVAKKKFVPVIVEPAKESNAIYDKAKQDMPHVDFTVTLALEG